jgi:predicted transposase YdaD
VETGCTGEQGLPRAVAPSGRKKGRKKGRKEGREEGRKEGRKEGILIPSLAIIRLPIELFDSVFYKVNDCT